MICDNCGAETIYFEKGSSCGQRCPKCGWDVVTTKPDPIASDTTTYSVLLIPGNKTDSVTLKAVSKACNVNYLAAKKIIEDSKHAIFSGKAWEILEKKFFLDEAGVTYEITPPFSHETRDDVQYFL